MEAKRLYLNNGLTLLDLAKTTGLSRHHISEVLNRYAGKNFYEFVNGYRVDHVKRQLVEDKAAKVLDIAIEAGFSSKTINSNATRAEVVSNRHALCDKGGKIETTHI